MFSPPRRRPTWPLLLLLPLLLILVYIHPPLPSLPSTLITKPTATTIRTATSHLKSPGTQKYWSDLHASLTATSPLVTNIKPSRAVSEEELDAAKSVPRPDLIALSPADLDALRSNHSAFVSSLAVLAPALPRWKGSRGIVMPAGGGYLGTAVTSILMLRRTGSDLPVHLFLDTPSERDPVLCDDVLPRLGVECLVFSDLLRPADGVKHYQYKVLSILLSPFEHVLYLDSDAWPIADPAALFSSEPFTSHGLVTWPDFWLTTMSPHFHDIAGFPPPDVLARRSSESGILLYDKTTHAESLLLATYYNWHGPGCYYPLLSQSAPGEGDKETFLQAALALNQTFWDVRTLDTVLGRWINGTFETAGMKQADPAEDYRLHAAAASEVQGHARGGDPPARTLFIHHNLFKVDMSRVGRPEDPMFRRDAEGRLGRLWGPDRGLVETSGFDVERAMWDVVLASNCGSSFSEQCVLLRRWYETVFVEAPPLVGES